MKGLLRLAAAVAVVFACRFPMAQAETWQPTTGTNFWSVTTNWDPQTVPNAVGATAAFTKPTTGVDSVAVDGAYTVGTLLFDLTGSTGNNDHRLVLDLLFPGGTLTLDDSDGEATITTQGTGIPNVDLSIPLVFNDDVVANVSSTTAQSAAAALSIDGAISGTGGFTKKGNGTLTFITGAKTYSGPTVFEGGKLRIRNLVAAPTNSSSVRFLSGAWMEPGVDGVLQMGTGTLFLNGSGDTVFPGVIRPDRTGTAAAGTGRVFEIPNPVVLESNSTIHSQTQNDTTLGSITFSGVVSGPGQLQLTSIPHNEQIGSYILKNDNTYSGGTLLRSGTLVVDGASADLGTGSVEIKNDTVVNGNATSRLLIKSGVLNAINDSATLTLGGGFNGLSAKAAFAELESGINETVAGLVLGATPQTMTGTYGSTASAATFQNDQFFTGPGIITLALPVVNDADFDGDGDVDGNDLLILQQGLGTTPNATNADGDANLNGTVDGTDLGIYVAAFGQGGTATASASPIPEPATAVLLIFAGTLLFGARRKQ